MILLFMFCYYIATRFLPPAPKSGRWLREILPITLYTSCLTKKIFFNVAFIPALLAQSEASLSEAGCGRSQRGTKEKKSWRMEKDWFQPRVSTVKMAPIMQSGLLSTGISSGIS